jgi:uncharacterized membrane protein
MDQHPAQDTPLDAARTTTLGFVAGLRSVMPLAILARHLAHEGPDIADGGWPIDLLASGGGATALAVAAALELVADKLPVTPSRLNPLPLVGRVVLGGSVGVAFSLSEGRASDRGALFGTLGAVAGSLAGYALRTKLPLPAWLLALVEDGLAFGLGRWAVSTR